MAFGCIVKLGETQSTLCESIYTRCPNLASITAKIRESKIIHHYQNDVGMVDSYTTQLADNSFGGMQAIDFIYLLLVGGGTINLGIPISCIGNNMSFRKKAYDEIGGYEALPFSVTEDFTLLRAIYKLKKYKILFPLEKDALVTSIPCPDFKSLYRQKKRWAVGGLGVPVRGFFIMFWGYVANLAIVLTPLLYSPVWVYLVFFKYVCNSRYFLVFLFIFQA